MRPILRLAATGLLLAAPAVRAQQPPTPEHIARVIGAPSTVVVVTRQR